VLPKFITDPNPDLYLSDSWFAFDLETTNLSKGDAGNEKNRLVYGYGYGPHVGAVHFYNLRSIFPILSSSDFVIAHGSKFELKWLIRHGYPVEKLLTYDTLLGDYCIAGNRKRALDLDSVSRRYDGPGKAGLVSGLIHSGVCPSEIPSSLLREYCQQDVEQTVHVFLRQRSRLRELGLHRVHYLRCLTTPVLADIELNGLFLDKELVNEIYTEYSREYREVASALDGITGGINMASAQQVATHLYTTLGFEELKNRRGPIRGKPNKKFPQGQPLTDEETLLKLKATTKAQKQFIELRLKESELRKKIGTYCELYADACGIAYTPLKDKPKKYSHVPGSCVVRGKLNQSIAQTHRLTSSNPNLQNLDNKLKKCFKARKAGWKILNADYKTLEMVVAGMLAQDPQVLDDIRNKHDFHKYTAQILLDEEEITKDERTAAKKNTFRPLYFGNSGTKKEKEYYDSFRERYEATFNMQRGWVQEALRTKQLVGVGGFISYWPNCEIQQSGYITNQTNIANLDIQRFATADIAPAGTLLLWHSLKHGGYQSFLINSVHDNVLIEVPEEELESVYALTEQCMSREIVPFFQKLYNYDINYPINVEIESHTNWGFDK
jgi:DNA polymerase I